MLTFRSLLSAFPAALGRTLYKRAGKLFTHVLSVLRHDCATAQVTSDYLKLLRTTLLPVPEYASRAGPAYSHLIDLAVTALQPACAAEEDDGLDDDVVEVVSAGPSPEAAEAAARWMSALSELLAACPLDLEDAQLAKLCELFGWRLVGAERAAAARPAVAPDSRQLLPLLAGVTQLLGRFGADASFHYCGGGRVGGALARLCLRLWSSHNALPKLKDDCHVAARLALRCGAFSRAPGALARLLPAARAEVIRRTAAAAKTHRDAAAVSSSASAAAAARGGGGGASSLLQPPSAASSSAGGGGKGVSDGKELRHAASLVAELWAHRLGAAAPCSPLQPYDDDASGSGWGADPASASAAAMAADDGSGAFHDEGAAAAEAAAEAAEAAEAEAASGGASRRVRPRQDTSPAAAAARASAAAFASAPAEPRCADPWERALDDASSAPSALLLPLALLLRSAADGVVSPNEGPPLGALVGPRRRRRAAVRLWRVAAERLGLDASAADGADCDGAGTTATAAAAAAAAASAAGVGGALASLQPAAIEASWAIRCLTLLARMDVEAAACPHSPLAAPDAAFGSSLSSSSDAFSSAAGAAPASAWPRIAAALHGWLCRAEASQTGSLSSDILPLMCFLHCAPSPSSPPLFPSPRGAEPPLPPLAAPFSSSRCAPPHPLFRILASSDDAAKPATSPGPALPTPLALASAACLLSRPSGGAGGAGGAGADGRMREKAAAWALSKLAPISHPEAIAMSAPRRRDELPEAALAGAALRSLLSGEPPPLVLLLRATPPPPVTSPRSPCASHAAGWAARWGADWCDDAVTALARAPPPGPAPEQASTFVPLHACRVPPPGAITHGSRECANVDPGMRHAARRALVDALRGHKDPAHAVALAAVVATLTPLLLLPRGGDGGGGGGADGRYDDVSAACEAAAAAAGAAVADPSLPLHRAFTPRLHAACDALAEAARSSFISLPPPRRLRSAFGGNGSGGGGGGHARLVSSLCEAIAAAVTAAAERLGDAGAVGGGGGFPNGSGAGASFDDEWGGVGGGGAFDGGGGRSAAAAKAAAAAADALADAMFAEDDGLFAPPPASAAAAAATSAFTSTQATTQQHTQGGGGFGGGGGGGGGGLSPHPLPPSSSPFCPLAALEWGVRCIGALGAAAPAPASSALSRLLAPQPPPDDGDDAAPRSSQPPPRVPPLVCRAALDAACSLPRGSPAIGAAAAAAALETHLSTAVAAGDASEVTALLRLLASLARASMRPGAPAAAASAAEAAEQAADGDAAAFSALPGGGGDVAMADADAAAAPGEGSAEAAAATAAAAVAHASREAEAAAAHDALTPFAARMLSGDAAAGAAAGAGGGLRAAGGAPAGCALADAACALLDGLDRYAVADGEASAVSTFPAVVAGLLRDPRHAVRARAASRFAAVLARAEPTSHFVMWDFVCVRARRFCLHALLRRRAHRFTRRAAAAGPPLWRASSATCRRRRRRRRRAVTARRTRGCSPATRRRRRRRWRRPSTRSPTRRPPPRCWSRAACSRWRSLAPPTRRPSRRLRAADSTASPRRAATATAGATRTAGGRRWWRSTRRTSRAPGCGRARRWTRSAGRARSSPRRPRRRRPSRTPRRRPRRRAARHTRASPYVCVSHATLSAPSDRRVERLLLLLRAVPSALAGGAQRAGHLQAPRLVLLRRIPLRPVFPLRQARRASDGGAARAQGPRGQPRRG